MTQSSTSKTPRVDAAKLRCQQLIDSGSRYNYMCGEAEQLETELAAANEKLADAEKRVRDMDRLHIEDKAQLQTTILHCQSELAEERITSEKLGSDCIKLQTTLAELMGVVEEQAELFCDIEESLSGYVDGAPDATNFSKTANYVNDNIAKQITAFNHFKQKHPEIK